MQVNEFNQEILEAKVTRTGTGCWEWRVTKPASTTGYATMSISGKSYNLHRVSFEIYSGRELQPGECVLHRCDNRLCINPDHLFVGSKGDNNRDRMVKGRSAVGERCHLSTLTEEQVIEIHDTPGSYRGLARIYGLNKGTIKQIKTEVTWRHLWK